MFKSIFLFCAVSLSISQAKFTVAITKFVPHPSLDAIEQGVRDALASSGLEIDIIADSAQANVAIAAQIVKKYVGKKVDLIVPITTPSAQTVYQAAKKSQIPVVFAGVSDPVAAKLIDSQTKKGDGITGVSDVSPIKAQVDLIKTLQPTIKTIGIVYNPSEANSVAVLERFSQEATRQNILIKTFACLSVSDLMMIIKSIPGKVDALYLPNDNTVISGLDVILKNLKDLPIYAADPESVARGCLGCVALGQYEIGFKAGQLAISVLKGTSPGSLEVIEATDAKTLINPSVAKRLNILIPEKLSFKLTGE